LAAVSALREEQYVISIVAAWDANKPDAHRGWARALYSALEPYGKEGIYVNLLNDDREGRVRASYGVNYERLVELKNAYDLDNFFHFNQNIRPARK
jgi:Berberine and berberine like